MNNKSKRLLKKIWKVIKKHKKKSIISLVCIILYMSKRNVKGKIKNY